MSIHEKFSDDNNVEHRTPSTLKDSCMKHGQCQTINNTAHYFQTPYSIALIVEQSFNYNMLLREQIAIEKDGSMKQNNVISDERRNESKSCTSAPECMPKMQNDKSDGDGSKVDDAWIKRKKCVPITFFSRSAKMKTRLKHLIMNIAC